MTHNIAKIRAFVDLMRNHAIAVAYGRQLYAADSALAELERAAAEPVAWRYRYSDGKHSSAWLTSKNPPPKDDAAVADVQMLYAAPPAPVAEIREPTPEECERICAEYERLLMREGTCGGRDAFDAVRSVMWPKERF